MLKKFTYNNTPQPDWLLVNEVRRPIFAPSEAVTMEIAGRRGAHYLHQNRGMKEINIDVTIMANSDNDLWTKAEYLAGWLDQGEPLPLTFNDEPERYYLAVFESNGDATRELAQMKEGTLTFICPDPYKYGLHYNFDLGDAVDTKTIVNNGTAPLQPRFRVEFMSPSNFISFVGPDGLVQYGTPAGVEQEVIEPYERVLTDYCRDLTPWSSTGLNIDFGIASGSFKVQDAHKFVVQDWGDTEATANTWHGPVIRRSIPETVQDFRAIFDIDLNNAPQVASRVEAWLLDAAGAIMARVIFWDRYMNGETNTVIVTAGPNGDSRTILESSGFPSSETMTWNGEFKGRIVLNRQGNDWRTSIKKLTKENRLSEASAAYDRLIFNDYLNPIAQIQIGIRKYGNTNGFYGAFRDIAIERINNVQPAQARAIFQTGDILEVDFAEGAAYLNGEYFNQELDPASRFFSFHSGITDMRILTSHPDAVRINVDYDERYK